MISVYIKKSDELAKTPTRANDSDAGYDLYSTQEGVIPAGGRRIVKTGISIAIPPGYYGRIAPRSGLAIKRGIDVLAGVVDSGYRGEVGVILINHSKKNFDIHRGMRIAQIIFSRVPETVLIEKSSLSKTKRDQGGFGSTGV